MKKHLFFYGLILCTYINLYAQINVNLSSPAWGPKVTTEEYYYLPEVNSYYDIHKGQYIYVDKGAWIRSKSLPPRFKSYNLKNGRVIVINDYHGPKPYVHYKKHKVKYYRKGNNGRGNGKPHGQLVKEKAHENHGKEKSKGNHGNGKGNGKGNQNKKDK